MIGKTLGHYEILGELGAGGMGAVYRARDLNLDREVAIKVLPEDFAADPERLARFDREAKLLASLNHPNIAAIYGFDEVDGQRFIAMERVEGESLADRIVGAGRVSVDDALEIAGQIAEALAAAHESGVVHRDLKPANIMVTPAGQAKVLDFGLAKALDAHGTSGSGETALSQSPTMAGATHTGVIMGTAAYMSPEQARGKLVDRRADIWAFGCVLYEALAGKAAFGGETVTDVLAAIVKDEPDWDALPPELPSKVAALLQRMLRKDPRTRLRDAGDIGLALQEVVGTVDTVAADPAAAQAPDERTSSFSPRTLAMSAVATAILVVIAAIAGYQSGAGSADSAPASVGVQRASIELPQRMLIQSLAIAPDGSGIALAGSGLYYRPIDGTDWVDVLGGAHATHVGISPDGERLVFTGVGGLQVVGLEGAPPRTIAPDHRSAWHPHWADDGFIYYGLHTGLQTESINIYRAHPDGDEPELLLELDLGERAGVNWPQLLPGGRHLLFTRGSSRMIEPVLEVADLETGERKIVRENAARGRYLDSGHIVYVTDGALLASPFDLDSLEISGEPAVFANDIRLSYGWMIEAAVSDNGTLVYWPGEAAGLESRFGWFNREGEVEELARTEQRFGRGRLSADGTIYAANTRNAQWEPDEIWLYDLSRDFESPLGIEGATSPVWFPNGQELAFALPAGAEAAGMFRRGLDRGAPVERLTQAPEGATHVPNDYTADGASLFFTEVDAEGSRDIVILDLASGEAEPWMRIDADVSDARLSPDNRWVVYVSNETGENEVFARRRDGEGGAVRISRVGGTLPIWVDSETILFIGAGYTWVTFDPITGEVVDEFSNREGTFSPNFDRAPGGRVLINDGGGSSPVTGDPFTVVFNWFEELNERIPINR